MQLLTNSRFLKLVCAEYNIDFLSACIAFGCNNPEANKLLEKYLEENYDALSNHKAK